MENKIEKICIATLTEQLTNNDPEKLHMLHVILNHRVSTLKRPKTGPLLMDAIALEGCSCEEFCKCKEEFDEYAFVAPKRLAVLDDETVIGEVCGYYVDLGLIREKMAVNAESDFPLEMDEIYQLRSDLSGFLLSSLPLFEGSDDLFFLNNIKVFETDLEIEEIVFGLLEKMYDNAIVYSVGVPEIDDDLLDLNDHYWRNHNLMLARLGYACDADTNFLVKTKNFKPVYLGEKWSFTNQFNEIWYSQIVEDRLHVWSSDPEVTSNVLTSAEVQQQIQKLEAEINDKLIVFLGHAINKAECHGILSMLHVSMFYLKAIENQKELN